MIQHTLTGKISFDPIWKRSTELNKIDWKLYKQYDILIHENPMYECKACAWNGCYHVWRFWLKHIEEASPEIQEIIIKRKKIYEELVHLGELQKKYMRQVDW